MRFALRIREEWSDQTRADLVNPQSRKRAAERRLATRDGVADAR